MPHSDRPHPLGHTAAPDDEGGYGPNPRSAPYRQAHARRPGAPPGDAWPAASVPDHFFAPSARGPKGYVRADERIREDICEQLMRRPDLEVRDVAVTVVDGVVVLDGTVPQRSMKHRIEDVCDATAGVRDIDNRLRVPRAGGSER
ncbi:MAG: BON domain-containing protein [Pseudomonadota bacterium]